MIPRPRVSTLFPYTTLFRSCELWKKFSCSEKTLPASKKPTPRRPADPSSGNSTSQLVISSLLPPTGKSMMPALGSLTVARSEEHTSELQSHSDLVCRLLLEK